MQHHHPTFRFVATLLAFLAVAGCAFVSVDVASLMQVPEFQERVLHRGTRDKLLVVEILGPISTTSLRSGLMPRQGTLERLDAVLTKADRDKNIQGLILKIDSPGGGYAASDLAYRRIQEYKAGHHTPVVACITGQGTSGAYLVALSADTIVALPSAVVGNVGVILPSISLEGLLDKLGIANQSIKSGTLKDAGNPLRDMNAADRQVLEDIVMEFSRTFLDLVALTRNVSAEELAVIADGRVMSASTAKGLHLIDETGYYETALKAATKLGRLEDPTVIVYRRRGENQGGFYSWP